jgi:hypothetical protein
MPGGSIGLGYHKNANNLSTAENKPSFEILRIFKFLITD